MTCLCAQDMDDWPSTSGGYGTIILDPPWLFRDRGSRATPRYPLMSDADILALPVSDLAAPDAHCYLWTTDVHLPLALDCLARWDFRFKQTLVWVKTTAAGKLRLGMGHYFRHTHELCLFATRGRAPFPRHDLPSVLFAPRGTHSAKPDRLLELAELVSPVPRLELFARRRRQNWIAWGDEITISSPPAVLIPSR